MAKKLGEVLTGKTIDHATVGDGQDNVTIYFTDGTCVHLRAAVSWDEPYLYASHTVYSPETTQLAVK